MDMKTRVQIPDEASVLWVIDLVSSPVWWEAVINTFCILHSANTRGEGVSIVL